MKTHVSHQNLLVRTWMQQALLRLMRPMVDFEARQVAVSALESVGHYTMFKAENPVFIFSANVT